MSGRRDSSDGGEPCRLSSPVSVRADLGRELTEGQGGYRRGGQAGSQDGQGPRLPQIRSDAEELGKESVELMGG